jgi:hypothetical protein
MPRMWNGYLVSAQNGIASLTARCANTNVAIPRRSSIRPHAGKCSLAMAAVK